MISRQILFNPAALGGLTLVCFLGSMIPFLGILFALPLHDLIILFVSSLLVYLLKIGPVKKIFLFLAFWVFISIGIELTRIDLYASGVRGVVSPCVSVKSNLVSEKRVVSIHGDINTILYAAGQKGFVTTEINVAGMRSPIGKSLFNRAGTVDIADSVFERGWTPRVGQLSYPRITIRRKYKNEIEVLSIVVQQSEEDTVARFERAYPLPDPYPGALDDGFNLLGPIFNNNFLRYIFRLNGEILLSSEIDQFLSSVLNNRIGDAEKLNFVDFSNVIRSEVQISPVEKGLGVEDVVKNQNSLWHNSLREQFLNDCPFVPVSREFGSDESGRTYVKLLEQATIDGRPTLLGHISPDNGPFSYLCDPKYKDMIVFGTYGKHLRISRYNDTGKLQSIAYLRKRMRFERPAQIVESSVIRTGFEVSSFSIAMPIVTVHSPQTVLVDDRFQRLDFTIP